MSDATRHPGRIHAFAALAAGLLAAAGPAAFGADYHAIAPTLAARVVTLSGGDLTIKQLVDVARYGAQVQLSAGAKQRQADNTGLLLEAAAEGVAVYWFNRGAGDQRETIMFAGDPCPRTTRRTWKGRNCGISSSVPPWDIRRRSTRRKSSAP